MKIGAKINLAVLGTMALASSSRTDQEFPSFEVIFLPRAQLMNETQNCPEYMMCNENAIHVHLTGVKFG